MRLIVLRAAFLTSLHGLLKFLQFLGLTEHRLLFDHRLNPK